MPRLSTANAVRQMMREYGQPQTVEAIQQYAAENSTSGKTPTWPELRVMVDDGELAAVDGGPNGKGGTLTLYGPGPNLTNAAEEPAAEPAEGEPTPAA